MKPSEYFFKKRIENQRWYDSDEANESTITELDKRFIDREELKDKINEILNKFAKTTDIDGRETLYKYTDCDLADLRAEILELIK